MLRPIFIFLIAFAAMEFVAYVAHRYVYHGLLWIFHKSHHEPRNGFFEWNDLFPLVFASVTIAVIWYATAPPIQTDVLALALGVTLYGIVYTVVHDIYVHRRIDGLVIRSNYLQRVKKAHMVHHATGGEPYGLLFFRIKEAATPDDIPGTQR
jgi:beta-carotene 3-hydroxylase